MQYASASLHVIRVGMYSYWDDNVGPGVGSGVGPGVGSDVGPGVVGPGVVVDDFYSTR